MNNKELEKVTYILGLSKKKILKKSLCKIVQLKKVLTQDLKKVLTLYSERFSLEI